MKKPRCFALVFAAFVLVAGALGWWWISPHSGSGLRLAADDPQVVLAGKTIYAARCAACHGQDLEGQPTWRKRRADGRLPAPPHDASGHTWHHSDELLIRLTLHGPQTMAGNDYASDMPAFDKLLSEADVIAVLSYIKSTWPKEIRAHHDRVNASARN